MRLAKAHANALGQQGVQILFAAVEISLDDDADVSRVGSMELCAPFARLSLVCSDPSMSMRTKLPVEAACETSFETMS